MEGRVTAGLGDIEEGIALLARVRGSLPPAIWPTTLHSSLWRSPSSTPAGQTEQVKTLVRHMTPIFQAHAIHREALAALTLLRQAAEREQVTEAFARELLSYLRKARYNPELRFEAR